MNLGNRHSQHSFSRVPQANIQRSVFNRSFGAKDTINFDQLTPVFIEEVLPGDTMNLNLKTFMRLATQAVPVLDNMYVDFYSFFVPNRLVWDNFVRQMGEQDNPTDSIDYLTPILNVTSGTFQFEVGTIGDKFGLPTDVNVPPAEDINALPFRMYNLIFNTWFRDQNLQNSLPVLKTDGPDNVANYNLVKSAKKHDYFTSALPFLQKGDPVTVPITGSAPVIGNGDPFQLSPVSSATLPRIINTDNVAAKTLSYQGAQIAPQGATYYPENPDYSGLVADFNTAIGADAILAINAFRQAIQLQSFLERDARGGTRYTEILTSHFRVTAQDFRLQRPEFLSGATINISQHPVAQTSETTPDSAQANLAAFSTAAEFGNKIGFSKSFVEHGFVMILARPRADVTYQQGLHKMWGRRTKFDYFWPEFQELGEQSVLNKEIYFQNSAQNEQVFGYQERYAEYRYRPSEIRGQFRSTYAQSLDVWHLAEEFSTLPLLNSAFIQGNTPIERVLTVAEGYPALLCDFFFDLKHVRPMVAYPVPASLGRF